MDSLSWLSYLGLHDHNEPEQPGKEYRKSIFETDENIIHSLDDDWESADQSEINRQYILDKHNADNKNASSTSSPPHTCHLDLQKLKQLQQQDENITKLIAKCKSSKKNETSYHLDKHIYRKIRDRPNIFHAIMVPKNLQPRILYECHNALGHNGSTGLYHPIRRNYYWENLHQNWNK